VATATATAEVAETAEPEAEETATPKKTPGFEAVFAISGLLAIAYLVLRQRD
jgi:PGF-CTERM protein